MIYECGEASTAGTLPSGILPLALSNVESVFSEWHRFQRVAPFSASGTVFSEWHRFQRVAPFSACGTIFSVWSHIEILE